MPDVDQARQGGDVSKSSIMRGLDERVIGEGAAAYREFIDRNGSVTAGNARELAAEIYASMEYAKRYLRLA
jgi:hypothetical protein